MYDKEQIARDILGEIQDDIIECILEGRSVEDFIQQNDNVVELIDSTVDNEVGYCDARTAVDILEEFDDFEETDSGLWEGTTGWLEQLRIVAYFTLRNAVAHSVYALAADLDTIESDDLREQALNSTLFLYNEGNAAEGIGHGDITREQFENFIDNERGQWSEMYMENFREFVTEDVGRII